VLGKVLNCMSLFYIKLEFYCFKPLQVLFHVWDLIWTLIWMIKSAFRRHLAVC